MPDPSERPDRTPSGPTPDPETPRPAPAAGTPSRRRLLRSGALGAGLLALAGCGIRYEGFGGTETVPPSPAELARRRMAAAIRAVVATTDVSSLSPAVRRRAVGVLNAQLQALGEPGTAPTTTRTASSGSSESGPTGSPSAGPLRATAKEVVIALHTLTATGLKEAAGADGALAARFVGLAAGAYTLELAVGGSEHVSVARVPRFPARNSPSADGTVSSGPSSASVSPAPSAPSPSAPPTPSGAAIPALQKLLGGLHAAVYGYQALAVRLDDQGPGRSRLDALEEDRDLLIEQLTGAKASVPPAQPGYELPFAVRTASQARELAGLLETRLAELLTDVLSADEEDRARTASWLFESATARYRFTRQLVAVPGMVVTSASTTSPTTATSSVSR